MMLLDILTGSAAGQQLRLAGPLFVLGAAPDADLTLPDPGIADRHALIERIADRVLVRSLDPTRLVLVRGEPVQVELLKPGDVLRLGEVEIRLSGALDEPVLSSADPPGGSWPRRSGEPDEIQLSLSTEQVSALLEASGDGDEEMAHRAQEQLRALYAINRLLGEPLDFPMLLQRLLEVVITTVEARRGFAVLQARPDAPPSLLAARERRKSGGFQEASAARLSKTILEHVLRTGEAVLTTDATHDSRFREGDSVHGLRIRSVLCVPLRGTQAVMGVLEVEADEHVVFTEDSLKLLACIGDMAGKVVEGARLQSESMERQRLATVGQTLASTAHHLKNLLTGLSAGADLIDLGLQDGDIESIAEGWRPIRRSLDGIQDLVLNMLDYAKERRPAREMIDVRELLEGLADVVRNRARGLAVTLALDLEPDLPLLQGDPVALHLALLNLLTNALEAIPPVQEGRIDVCSVQVAERNELAISITDNGVGIPVEAVPRIFEIFYSSKGSRGTGFGLAVTYKIIEEHQGRIELETEVGCGSTFTVYLPLTRTETTPA